RQAIALVVPCRLTVAQPVYARLIAHPEVDLAVFVDLHIVDDALIPVERERVIHHSSIPDLSHPAPVNCPLRSRRPAIEYQVFVSVLRRRRNELACADVESLWSCDDQHFIIEVESKANRNAA